MTKKFHSNGKLLLTGEYLVLDGAVALGLPTKYGQSLTVETSNRKTSEISGIHWKSLDDKGEIWFEDFFTLDTFQSKNTEDPVSQTLSKILKEAKKLNPNFLSEHEGIIVTTNLDFPLNWGLGSSSTLINNIAQWAEVDPFALLAKSYGGSGYDIAAAIENNPFFYELNDEKPEFHEAYLPWSFKDSMFFIHLNVKQSSKAAVSHYRKATVTLKDIDEISSISEELTLCHSLWMFQELLDTHEQILSNILAIPPVKTQLFSDYPHTIKSLGAWGGDFVLATGNEEDMDYFRKKGYNTIIPFSEMIK